MLIVIIVIAVLAYVFAIPSPEPRVIVIEKRVTVVERPVEVHNHYQVNILVANVDPASARNALEPARSAEPRALVGASTALERYRRN